MAEKALPPYTFLLIHCMSQKAKDAARDAARTINRTHQNASCGLRQLYHTPLAKSTFLLSLHDYHIPMSFADGWVAGSNSNAADILIFSSSPAQTAASVPAGVSFRIFFSRPGGVLMFACAQRHGVEHHHEGRWKPLVLGEEIVLSAKAQHNVRIGDFEYLVEFVFPGSKQKEMKYLQTRNMKLFGDDWIAMRKAVSFYPPKPGDVKFKYGNVIVDRSIGHGGFGHVSRGFNVDTGSPIAVKDITSGFAKERDDITKEIKIAQSLRGAQNCLPINKSVCEHGDAAHCSVPLDRVYLTMELGLGDLDDDVLISLSRQVKFRLSRESLKAIAAVHEKGYMHRDVTLHNIMVMELQPPVGKLFDFGKATTEAESQETGVCPAKAAAPEMCGPRKYSNSVDVWQWALVMCEFFELVLPEYMTAGRGQTARERECFELQESLLRVHKEQPQWGPLYMLIRSMLAFDPTDRPSAAFALDSKAWNILRDAEAQAEAEEDPDVWSEDETPAARTGARG